MAKTKKKETLDLTTEEKIKVAALKIFMQKGFAATRTRDISEEAGINLALLNYYFRSKEKLFEWVMLEILQNFFRGITQIFNDEASTVDQKVKMFVNEYTELLKQQPDLPLFIFHELRMNPEKFASKMGVHVIFKSLFFKQLTQDIQKSKIADVHPLHYVINMIGMCVFPFIAAPIFRHAAGVDTKSYAELIEQRKTLVPHWMKLIMKSR
ncbi:MAG: TetR/AcrR family transcriptional regulator [Chryseosolibacter sp.]